MPKPPKPSFVSFGAIQGGGYLEFFRGVREDVRRRTRFLLWALANHSLGLLLKVAIVGLDV